jgi:hypothetical protein
MEELLALSGAIALEVASSEVVDSGFVSGVFISVFRGERSSLLELSSRFA